MLITCEDCDSRFQLDDSLMKEEGVKVKCSKCGKVFKAYAPASIETSVQSPAAIQGFDEGPVEEEKGLDFSEMEAMLDEADDSDSGIFSNEASGITDSGFGFEETNELDLSDMDQLFEGDEVTDIGSFAADESEGIDFELDEIKDSAPSLGGTADAVEEIEELELLDVDEEIDEAIPADEIEELELDIDEAIDDEVADIEVGADMNIEEELSSIESDALSSELASGPGESLEEFGLTDAEMKSMFDEQPVDEDIKDIEDDAELSFDLEGTFNNGEVPEETAAEENEMDEEAQLSFDLDKGLGLDEISEDTAEEDGLGGGTDLSFDLEEELADDEDAEAFAAEAADLDEDEGISFDLEELDIDENSEEMVSGETKPEEGPDEFEELGMTDIEEMFNLEDGLEAEEEQDEDSRELDLEMEDISESLDESAHAEIDVEAAVGDLDAPEEPEEDLGEFEEFGLTDLEEMFNLEAEPKPEAPEPVAEDPAGLDFGDDNFDDGDPEELEFKLDEAIAVLDGSREEEAGVEFEEYEELDLSELDEMFDREEFVPKKQDTQEEELGDLNFDSDTVSEAEDAEVETETEEDLGIADTSELDFSDIGEMLESDAELDLPDTPAVEEDESGLDFGSDLQEVLDDEPSLDFGSDLQEVLDDESGIDGILDSEVELDLPDIPEMEEEESGLELESEDLASLGDGLEMGGLEDALDDKDELDLSDEDLDLSEMEKMFAETDELEQDVPATSKTTVPPPLPEEEKEELFEPQDDLDFGLDEEDAQEDFFQTEEAQDIELEFGVEEEVEEEAVPEEPPPLEPAEMKKTSEVEEDDIEATYDMGIQLDELRKKQAADKLKGVKVEEKTLTADKTKTVRKGRTIPFEKKKKTAPLLVVLFLIIIIAVAPVFLTNMGINIPYASDYINDLGIQIPFADKIQLANIPYISDMIQSNAPDEQGVSKITLLEPSINGYYVENSSGGIMFVISGSVRNDYTQMRNFISVKGQIYSTGKKNIESKTVYAGNVLSEEKLAASDPIAIDKQLANKFGANRSNFKIASGKSINFMIVFTKVPDDLEGYDVEVAGSTLHQENDGKK